VFDSFENVPGGTTGWLLRLTVDKQGVRQWDTLTAEMDLAGTPYPVRGAMSPCGVREGRGRHAPVTLARCANP